MRTRGSLALAYVAVHVTALGCGGTHTPPVATGERTGTAVSTEGPSPAQTVTVNGVSVPLGTDATDAGTRTIATAVTDAGAMGTREAERLYQEGMQAYGRGDFQTAARDFAAAYEQHPAPDLAFNAGRMYERLAMVPEATRYYTLVLAGAPEATQRADVTARLASLRDYERRRREDFAQPPPGTDALAREAGTWFVRGVTLYRRRQYEGALRAFEAAHQYTDTPELLFNLAVTQEHLGHGRDAAEAFRAYLQQRPDAPDRPAIELRLRALEHGGP